ncbi:MAG: hypothetical protein HYT27_02030 [Parcubacteria group bacterium]|nr:hypothetical protein [Parcubacteria group bacterium]
MRKVKKYFEFFWLPLLLLAAGIFLWFYIPDGFSNFKSTLIGSFFGISISLAAADGFKRLTGHKRIKKTFGMLELIAMPYLKNQSQNIRDTVGQYQDICSIEQAISFLAVCAHLDRVALNFDKSWLQLTYSQEFLDAINSDEHFNKISHAIFEVLLFTKQLSAQSINAQSLLLNDVSHLTDAQKTDLISRTKNIRNALFDSAEKLQKYTERLEEEIRNFLNKTGSSYSEFER